MKLKVGNFLRYRRKDKYKCNYYIGEDYEIVRIEDNKIWIKGDEETHYFGLDNNYSHCVWLHFYTDKQMRDKKMKTICK